MEKMTLEQDTMNLPVAFKALQTWERQADKGKGEAMERLKNWRAETKFRQSGTNLAWEVQQCEAIVCGKPSGFYGVMREDTGKVFQMARAYEVFQNWELLQLCELAAGETSIMLKNLGYLGAGELVFIQGTTGNIVIGNDTVQKYVTTLNSHDGSTALKWGLSNTVVVCQNTFFAAYHQVGNRAKHTSNMRNKIAGLITSFSRAKEKESNLYDSFARMAETPVSQEAVFRVVENIIDIKREDLNTTSTVKKNQAAKLRNIIESELASHGRTIWGAFNAGTYFTTHLASKDAENREYSKMTGQSQKRDNDLLQSLMNLVPAKTLVTV